jgi:pimeloyl-ACP methyl ester carboxylesterase
MLAYRKIGSGPQHVLVLHGWFGDEATFEPLLPSLSLDRFTYCCVAYRGYGGSMDLTGAFTLKEIAADALEVADHLGWARIDIVGHSMGAKAAQKLLLRAADRVGRIVAVAPVPAARIDFDAQDWELFSGAAEDVAKRAAIIDFSTGGRLSGSWIEGLATRSWQRSTQAAFAGYLRAWALEDFAVDVVGLGTRVLALIGAHDPQVNEAAMQASYLAAYPNAAVGVIGNAGHYPMDEAPIDLATRMEAFLSE